MVKTESKPEIFPSIDLKILNKTSNSDHCQVCFQAKVSIVIYSITTLY